MDVDFDEIVTQKVATDRNRVVSSSLALLPSSHDAILPPPVKFKKSATSRMSYPSVNDNQQVVVMPLSTYQQLSNSSALGSLTMSLGMSPQQLPQANQMSTLLLQQQQLSNSDPVSLLLSSMQQKQSQANQMSLLLSSMQQHAVPTASTMTIQNLQQLKIQQLEKQLLIQQQDQMNGIQLFQVPNSFTGNI